MPTTDRPLAFWLTYADTDPEPDSARPSAGHSDTMPAPPPSAGRYCLVAAERVATAPPRAPASRVRACRQTDPCITPPPGSDRMGSDALSERVAILSPPWAPARGASNNEGKG